MSCLLQVEPNLRSSALNPGRLVKVVRGGSVIWRGKLSEPVPSADGWQVSAIGVGALGNNFQAHFTSWTADNPINLAIARGLPWINPGLSGISGLWLSQQQDDASMTVTDFLNLLVTNGALTWYIDGQNVLRIIPIPTVPTRILIATDPQARTVAADINSLWVRYQITGDQTGDSSGDAAAATYGTVEATNAASQAVHGVMESYEDLSSAGTISSSAAQQAGASVLAAYQRATYSGPFNIRQGQLLTMGGTPIDIGAERGIPQVASIVLTNTGSGGEVIAGQPTTPIGAYEYDDDAQTAAVTPLQSTASDLSSLLAAMFPTNASGGITLSS